jgi:hypothetical protein
MFRVNDNSRRCRQSGGGALFGVSFPFLLGHDPRFCCGDGALTGCKLTAQSERLSMPVAAHEVADENRHQGQNDDPDAGQEQRHAHLEALTPSWLSRLYSVARYRGTGIAV